MGFPDLPRCLRFAPTLLRSVLCSRTVLLGLLLCLTSLLIGADPLPRSPAVPQDSRLLQDLTRTLEEEVKLASKPQPYLLLDLTQSVVLMKGRGVVLRQFPLLGWRTMGDQPTIGSYRLRARPPVTRPRIQPGQDSTEHPIDVHDMPMEFLLAFDHDLVIEVIPPLAERPWHWFKRKWLSSWIRLRSWVSEASDGEFPTRPPRLSVTLSHEEAQALAWTVTEGMPLLIGRVELP